MKKDNSDQPRSGPEHTLRRVGGGVRRRTIRRQLYIYLSLITAGFGFIVESGLEKMHLISEGVAFIMVGVVGLIMSMTTTDIGQGLMHAVREEGDKTRSQFKVIVADFMEAVREDGRQTRALIEERDMRMEKRMDRMSGAIEAMSGEIKAMSGEIKAMSGDNREFFRQMLVTQNRILEKMS